VLIARIVLLMRTNCLQLQKTLGPMPTWSILRMCTV